MAEFNGTFPDQPFEEVITQLSRHTGQPEEEIREFMRLHEAEEITRLTDDTGTEKRKRKWLDEALRDEEHMHHTVWLYLNTPPVAAEVRSGLLSPAQAAAMASFVVSDLVTKKHFGASIGVGEAVARMVELPLE